MSRTITLARALRAVSFLPACVLAFAHVTAAHAQSRYPTRLIRIIVPFAPSGGTDILARALGARMSESMGQTLVVENRPGANSIIGTDAVAKSAPDGHT